MNRQVNDSLNKLERDVNPVPQSDLFSINELHNTISSLKMRKTPGPGEDGIHNIFIKNFTLAIRMIILMIMNACFEKSLFPNKWKSASIFRIPKIGKDQTLPTGYRPISLLSNLGKLLEKLLLLRLNKFVRDKNIVKNHQFGFRDNHSTTQQLIRLSKFASIGFNNDKSTGALSLDIENAFDTTRHDGSFTS